MKRVKDWRDRLAKLIEARRRTPFSEQYNCAMFLADCVMEMTGEDLAAPYRDRFSTLAEGIALLQADGYADLCDFMKTNLEEIHPMMARAGDVMVFTSDLTGWAGGIVNGERVTVLTPRGLGNVSRDDAMRAFRVG